MILLEVRIGSFAALSSFEVELSPGLNVILGPNEAGKSTLFQAILHCLLTPVSLSRAQFQSQLGAYLPVGGGDTLSCTLVFRLLDRRFRLSKSWGATRAVELELPDGSRVTDEQTAASTLAELLPAAAGTVRSVLAASQSGLSATVAELEREQDTLHGLGDLLRRSVLATDGVSVVRFREEIRRRREELLDRWDLERGCPEGNKGIENRWKRKVGGVLEAFYQAEELRLQRDQVLQRERELGELGRQLQACLGELQQGEAVVRELEPAARDARERRPLETELGATQGGQAAAQRDYEEWTQAELQAESLGADLVELQQAQTALEEELARAEAGEAGRGLRDRLRDRLQRARARAGALEQAQAKAQQLPRLSREHLEQLRRAAGELARAEAAAQAGGLSLALQARRKLTVSAQADLQQATEHQLGPAQALELQAAGRLVLEHPDWRLEIRAGAGRLPTTADAAEGLQGLLATHGVRSLQEAEQRVLACEQAQAELVAAQRLLDEELAGEAYAALEARFAELSAAGSPVAPTRPLGTVAQELGRVRARVTQTREKIETGRRRLEALRGRWATRDAALARAVELAGLCREIEGRLASLAPLPAGFADTASFLEHWEAAVRSAGALREQRARLEAECRAAGRNLGEESSEEIGARLEEARARFQGRLHTARVLQRVEQAGEEILGSAEAGVEEPFRRRFAEYLSALTGGRYAEAAPSRGGTLPKAVLLPDRGELPYALLSAGTRDAFALALRLAMAEVFLGEREGFLMMDDPLVDLDPERQRLAAAVLSRFAARRQLLLFTCQPSHAVLLGAAEASGAADAGAEARARRIELPGLGPGPGQEAVKGKAARSRRR